MEDVDQTLEVFAARRILVGHTIVPTVTPLYGGKVIAVQVQPKHDDAGKASFESLMIRDGQFWQAALGGRLRPLSGARPPQGSQAF